MFKPRPNRRTHALSFVMEGLENRALLSAALFGMGHGQGRGHGSPSPYSGETIEFDQAPTAVQTGLGNLAAADNLTAPTSTQTVNVGNTNGVETYTVDISGTGIKAALTVDSNGNPVTAPTKTTTTWAALDGTGTSSDSAAVTEISAVATALDLTAPTSSTSIIVVTESDGTVIYRIHLSGSKSSPFHGAGTTISVDSNGNLVGDEIVPFSVVLPAVQNGLIASAPAGVTLTSSSTQNVFVQTYDGVPTYTMIFKGTGTTTTITVNESGALVSLPSKSTTTFTSIPTAAQTELQTLATDDGVTTAISSTQSVSVSSETNGTTVYTVDLTNSDNQSVVLSVDEDGNPTVPAGGQIGSFGGGREGGGCGAGGGFGFGSRR
jgi:hypothetical protein